MASTEIKGQVYHVGEIEQINDTFRKRVLIIEDNEKPDYVQYIKMEVKQDKVTLLDSLKLGQTVTAHININGRKYTDKKGEEQVFVTLDCWRLDMDTQAQNPPVDINTPAGEEMDMPF